MIEKKTSELLDILNSIDDCHKLNKYVSNELNNNNTITIPKLFDKICKEKHLSKSTLINNAEIDRTYGYQILNGSKNPSRDNIIKLCLSAQLTLEETEHALIAGNVRKLYAKDIRDTFLIFAINNKISVLDTNILLDENNQKTLSNL